MVKSGLPCFCNRHFPGELLSVKPSTANHLPGLLHLNERVAWIGRWRHGFFSMTAVAALNVGDIVEEGCDDLQTNKVSSHILILYSFTTADHV